MCVKSVHQFLNLWRCYLPTLFQLQRYQNTYYRVQWRVLRSGI
jgi:hypothetical protein